MFDECCRATLSTHDGRLLAVLLLLLLLLLLLRPASAATDGRAKEGPNGDGASV